MDAYVIPEGCELLCEDCAPAGAEGYPEGGGEADSPAHCAVCHQPFDNPLTSDGVEYVLEANRDSIGDAADWDTVKYSDESNPDYYYEGSPRYAVVRDWAKQLRSYDLSKWDGWLVSVYLELTEGR